MSEAMDKAFDKRFGKKPENPEDLRTNDQRTARLEQNARQPSLPMEADGPADIKTRKRTEGAVKAVQAMNGDSFSSRRIDPGLKTNSTSFGVKAEPPVRPCRDNLSGSIVYTEQGENHETMILREFSYSAYTLRYESYCRYGIAPSSQSFLNFYDLYLTSTVLYV